MNALVRQSRLPEISPQQCPLNSLGAHFALSLSRSLCSLNDSLKRNSISRLSKTSSHLTMSSTGAPAPATMQGNDGTVLSGNAVHSVVNIGILTNKIALITGASSGLGRAIAQAYAAAGAYIVSGDITPNPPVTPLLAETMKARGDNLDLITPTVDLLNKNFPSPDGTPRAIYVECNVLKPESIEAAVQATVTQYGRLDVMINNAGRSTTK